MNNLEGVFSFVRSECERIGVDKSAYGVGDDFVNGLGEYVFSFRDGKWIVFLYERGNESDFSMFDNSYNAIRFFVMNLCTDHENLTLPKILFKNLPD